MSDPLRVGTSGPLSVFAAGFREELLQRGYRPGTAAKQLQLMAHLSRCMAAHEVEPSALDGVEIERFVRERRASHMHLASARGLGVLLAYLRELGEDVRVSERDVNRIVKGVRAGKGVEDVFPRLRSVATTTTSSGANITVRFVKKGGAPVTYVAADDPAQAAAVREVDLQRKYHRSANELADAVGLKRNKATALRRYLGIDDDKNCRHVFEFGSQKIVRYSDNAYRRMKEALDSGVDMDDVWAKHGWGGRRAKTPDR